MSLLESTIIVSLRLGIYEELSKYMLEHDVFTKLLTTVLSTNKYDDAKVVRILELCACHSEGVSLLITHLSQITEKLKSFLTQKNSIKYPTVTVILDLSACETDINKVALSLCSSGIFEEIQKELRKSLLK